MVKEQSNNMDFSPSAYKLQLSDADFKKLSHFIYNNYGIKMPDAKKIMLQSRLQKRLSILKLNSFTEYCDFVFSKEGEQMELIHMIDVVTTNKTDFFREAAHFDFLREVVLPEYHSQNKGRKPMKVWSAGCSSGEEPYTLTFVLSDFLQQNSGFDYSILGTDISMRILEKAITAIYPEDRVSIVPLETKRKYLLKSKDRQKPSVRIVPELRKKVSFQRLNFMDSSYEIPDVFDVIFCRNVLIYFDRPTQESVINKLCSKLRTGGYFFLGHSESITSMKVPLVQLKPTVFMKV